MIEKPEHQSNTSTARPPRSGYIPLKKDDLGELSGLSPREVEGALLDLEARGIICTTDEGLIVLDSDRLAARGLLSK